MASKRKPLTAEAGNAQEQLAQLQRERGGGASIGPTRKPSEEKARRRPGPQPRIVADPGDSITPTTYRVTRTQLDLVQRVAFARRLASGQRFDASAVIRELIDEARERLEAEAEGVG